MPKSILKRTTKRTPGKRSRRRVRVRGRKKPKRPYVRDKAARLRRRHRVRRHHTSKIHGHHGRMRREAETLNYLMHQLLKTAAATEADPYHYEPRHFTKDPEYQFSDERTQEFKRGVPAPDTHFWRPQGKTLPPHRGNYRHVLVPADQPDENPPHW